MHQCGVIQSEVQSMNPLTGFVLRLGCCHCPVDARMKSTLQEFRCSFGIAMSHQHSVASPVLHMDSLTFCLKPLFLPDCQIAKRRQNNVQKNESASSSLPFQKTLCVSLHMIERYCIFASLRFSPLQSLQSGLFVSLKDLPLSCSDVATVNDEHQRSSDRCP